jgi:hypothetical protein
MKNIKKGYPKFNNSKTNKIKNNNVIFFIFLISFYF